MAQCKDCYSFPKCDYLKHPSNRELTPENYHNCQEFDGIIAGYQIHRTGGNYPEGQVVIQKIK